MALPITEIIQFLSTILPVQESEFYFFLKSLFFRFVTLC
jgi:hypothetical protein